MVEILTVRELLLAGNTLRIIRGNLYAPRRLAFCTALLHYCCAVHYSYGAKKRWTLTKLQFSIGRVVKYLEL